MVEATLSLRKKNLYHLCVSTEVSTVRDIFISLRSIVIFFFSSALETSLMRHLPYELKVLSFWNFVQFFSVSKFIYHLLTYILTAIIHSWNIKKTVLPWLSKEEQVISLRSDPHLNIEIVPWPSFCLAMRMQLHFSDHVTSNISVQEVYKISFPTRFFLMDPASGSCIKLKMRVNIVPNGFHLYSTI